MRKGFGVYRYPLEPGLKLQVKLIKSLKQMLNKSKRCVPGRKLLLIAFHPIHSYKYVSLSGKLAVKAAKSKLYSVHDTLKTQHVQLWFYIN